MMNFLLFLMLNINPETQLDTLFVANDSLFDIYSIKHLPHLNAWRFYTQEHLTAANTGTIFTIDLPIN